MTTLTRLLMCVACCAFQTWVLAASGTEYINGKVQSIPDGDTLWIDAGSGNRTKIRLYAIDCPEIAQPHGVESQRFTSQFCDGKRVSAIVRDTDRGNKPFAEIVDSCRV